MQSGPLVAAALVLGMALAGCLGGPSPDPGSSTGGIVLDQDVYYTPAETSLFVEGILELDKVPEGDIILEATTEKGWECEFVSVETTDDPRQLRFLMNITPGADVLVNQTTNVTLIANVDGSSLSKNILVSVQPLYRLTNSFDWDRSHLNILIIPPTHGSVASTHQGALPYGPEGALPMGLYLDATLHVLDDWRYALDRFAENHTEIAWVANITWETHVVAADLVTPDMIAAANIIKFYPETTYPILGAAVYAGMLTGDREPGCLAYSTMLMTYGSMTYEDMYYVAGHELLHCFGMSHPDRMDPYEDIMSYESWPIPDLRCPSNLNVLAAARAFSDVIEGATDLPIATVFDPEYVQYCSPESDPRA